MKRTTIIIAGLLCLASAACSSRPVRPQLPGQLDVRVEWQDQGLPDRRLLIVETGHERWTDLDGRAGFTLTPGHYTLRAFVNVGGPAGHSDHPVTIRAARTESMEIQDCLPCVGPQ